MAIYVEGKVPLRGTVNVSGAKNSAVKLIFAAMFSNDDVILDNVPHLESIQTDLDIINSIGGRAEWIGKNKLLLNGSSINTHEIPFDLGSRYRTAFLLAGPLLHKFGKARIPQTTTTLYKLSPVNRIVSTWQALGFDVKQDDQWITITASSPVAAEISFRTTTHTGTENAILSSMLIDGETLINNASEEPEIEDLIAFANVMGAVCERVEPRKIRVVGTNVFKGGTFEIQPDKYEVAVFAAAALMTRGNIAVTGIRKLAMVPFVNFLTKIKANFEIQDRELRVWDTNILEGTNLTVAPSPGFIHDWISLAILILTRAQGKSLVHDTVYVDKLGFVKDLNRMGADIDLVLPSTESIIPIISDDSYDFANLGEPRTLARIIGPSKLHSEKFHITDPRYANLLILAALSADGRTEINGYKSSYEESESFFDKLLSLGAKIYRDEYEEDAPAETK